MGCKFVDFKVSNMTDQFTMPSYDLSLFTWLWSEWWVTYITFAIRTSSPAHNSFPNISVSSWFQKSIQLHLLQIVLSIGEISSEALVISPFKLLSQRKGASSQRLCLSQTQISAFNHLICSPETQREGKALRTRSEMLLQAMPWGQPSCEGFLTPEILIWE